MRREELRMARKYMDEAVGAIMAELNGDTVNCHTRIGPDKLCGHSITSHEGDESGMGAPEPCNMCGCENFTRLPLEATVSELDDGNDQNWVNTSAFDEKRKVVKPPHGARLPLYVQPGTAERVAEIADMQYPGTTVAKWADQAMFTAEPINANEGPKVHLLWMTADPLAVIAAPSKMYKGEVARSLRDVTHAERQEYVEQLKATKLKAPYEFVKFHFLIEGVTRAFTHQMVRQRTAVYAQESLRFAVKEDMPVALPPSIASLPEDHRLRRSWDKFVEGLGVAYRGLVDNGIPAEDARGLLPHNTLTRLHYCTDLRALLDHAGNRLCTQAQFEWRLVFAKIAQAIREYNPYNDIEWKTLNLGDEGAYDFIRHCYESERWQYEAIADLFRPVCYLTGKCEFKANFDRKCSIRGRVDKLAEHGVPSSEWGEEHSFAMEPPYGDTVIVPPIRAAEWLLDPGAAR